MAEQKKDQGIFPWLAEHSGAATVVLVPVVFGAATAALKFLAGMGDGWSVAGGLAATGVAYKVLSKSVVENVDDPYNNLFVTSAKQDARDASRIVVSGVIFVPRENKKPIAFRRDFSVAREELAKRGLKLEAMGNKDGTPTHLISMDARGRYVNFGFPNHTFMMPRVVRINEARALDASDQDGYKYMIRKLGGKIVSRTVPTMGSFARTLAP